MFNIIYIIALLKRNINQASKMLACAIRCVNIILNRINLELSKLE